MNKITQTMRFRQAVIEYSNKHGVTAAAIRYRLNRQYVYRWRKEVRRYTPIAGRPLSPAASPPKPTYTGGNQAHSEYAPPQSEHWDRCAVGQAQTERLYPLHFRVISFPAKTRRDSSKAVNPQVYPQTLRADAISRPACSDRCEVCAAGLHYEPAGAHTMVSIYFPG